MLRNNYRPEVNEEAQLLLVLFECSIYTAEELFLDLKQLARAEKQLLFYYNGDIFMEGLAFTLPSLS